MAEEMNMDKRTGTEDAVETVAPEMDALEQKLTELGATPEIVQKVRSLGAVAPDDLSMLKEADLTGAGVPTLVARKLILAINPVEPAPAEGAPATPARENQPMTVLSMESVLPTVPADDAWLSILKTGGVLKVDQATYIAAIRAALADRTQLYQVPQKLVEALEKFAYDADEPVSADFYKLMNQLTRRNYGDLFSAIDGLNGTFVSEKRKKELLSRINTYLWPAVAHCYQQLNAWQQAWVNGFNPSLIMASYIPGGGVALPPGMGQAPDTSPLHDVGDDLRNALNKTLAGPGSVVASAMAYDYRQIKSVLEDSSLPAKIGAANREQMYKRLGLTVDASMIRAEMNIVKFIMGFVQTDGIAADNEIGYYTALFTLGSQINWSQLGLAVSKPDDGGPFTTLSGDTL